VRTFSFTVDGALLALLITITRQDESVIRINTSDLSVTIGGVTWVTSPGLQVGDFTERNDGTIPKCSFTVGMDRAGPLSPLDVNRKKFEGADIYIEICDAANPTTKDLWFDGKMLGAVNFTKDRVVTFECVSALAVPRDIFVRQYQLLCDADFGSVLRCKIPTWVADVQISETIAVGDTRRVRFVSTGTPSDYLNVYLECTAITTGVTAGTAPTYSSSVSGTTTDGGVTWTTRNALVRYARIATIIDDHNFTLDSSPDSRSTVDDWYNPGRIVMRSGYMKNKATRVGAWTASTKTVTVYETLGSYIAAGDWVEICPDCDHTPTMCLSKYNNRGNYRGFDKQTGAKAVSATVI
jgi:hypothetical protein